VTAHRRSRASRRRFEGNPHTPRQWLLWLLDRWQEFVRTPEPLLMDAGAAGEHLVARIRVILAALVLLIPVVDRFLRPGAREVRIGLLLAGAGLLLALLAYRLGRGRLYQPWIGFTTSLLDVTLVSLALVSFLFIDQPFTTLNSRVVYPIYLVAIAASALRFDPRICAVTGLVAMLEYLAVVLYTATSRTLSPTAADAIAYGQFDWSDQVSRLMLLAIASIVSTSLVLRTRRLQWLSARDRLTDVMNRGVFEDLLAAEAARVRRAGGELALLLVDVDRFGAFNAMYGQAAGDRTLRLVAAAIDRACRPRGYVARYGADEFAVLLPESGGDGVADLAEAIRDSVAGAPTHPTRMSQPESLTVSIGIARLPRDASDGREACARAEQRLAQAKAAGGDRVVSATTLQGGGRH
jgi:diguanylate cyclase (GGDEF)-like protein